MYSAKTTLQVKFSTIGFIGGKDVWDYGRYVCSDSLCRWRYCSHEVFVGGAGNWEATSGASREWKYPSRPAPDSRGFTAYEFCQQDRQLRRLLQWYDYDAAGVRLPYDYSTTTARQRYDYSTVRPQNDYCTTTTRQLQRYGTATV